jgi:hypothetical protein
MGQQPTYWVQQVPMYPMPLTNSFSSPYGSHYYTPFTNSVAHNFAIPTANSFFSSAVPPTNGFFNPPIPTGNGFFNYAIPPATNFGSFAAPAGPNSLSLTPKGIDSVDKQEPPPKRQKLSLVPPKLRSGEAAKEEPEQSSVSPCPWHGYTSSFHYPTINSLDSHRILSTPNPPPFSPPPSN